MDFVRGYLAQLQQTLDYLPVERINEVIGILHSARLDNRLVFIMGNGGSASTASHFVADLAKNTRHSAWPSFRVVGLTDNVAALTAYANDEGYETVFANQLASLVSPEDIVIAISASGNSPNVLRAIELANQVGALTIGFTGFNGGALAQISQVNLHVPSQVIEQVEDIHLMFEHVICKALREHPDQIQAWQPGETAGIPGIEIPTSVPSLSLDLLQTLQRELGENSEPRQGLLRLLQISMQGVGAASGSMLLLGEDGQLAEAVMAYQGKVHFSSVQQLVDTLHEGLAGWVVENRQAALVANTHNDPRWLSRDWEQGDCVPRSAVSVPLMNGARVAGVLTLTHSQPGRFSQDHLVLSTAIAVFISLSAAQLLTFERA